MKKLKVHCFYYNLRNTNTDARLPNKKTLRKDKMSFPSVVLRYGIAMLLKQDWQPHYGYSKKPFKNQGSVA